VLWSYDERRNNYLFFAFFFSPLFETLLSPPPTFCYPFSLPLQTSTSVFSLRHFERLAELKKCTLPTSSFLFFFHRYFPVSHPQAFMIFLITVRGAFFFAECSPATFEISFSLTCPYGLARCYSVPLFSTSPGSFCLFSATHLYDPLFPSPRKFSLPR